MTVVRTGVDGNPLRQRPLGEVLRRLSEDVSLLVRQEVELAKAEMSEKLSQVTTALVSLLAGGVILFVALLVLIEALVLGLAAWLDMAVGWSALIVGVVLAIIGAIALQSGRNKLKAQNLAPRRTAESLRRDTDLIKEQVR